MTAQKERRCLYRSPTGRRCRIEPLSGWQMCTKHSTSYYCSCAAADEIVSNRDRLDTAEGIHAVMARVIRAQAAGKILARDATAMIYSCQAKLYTLPRLAAERKKVFLAEEEDVWREKVLADSHHDKLNCEESSEAGDEEENENEPDAVTAESKKK